MIVLYFAVLILAVYLIGSIPTAFLMGRVVKGVDIRTVGSGNVGATNVIRSMGFIPGVTTLIIDLMKGYLAVALIAPLVCADIAYLPLFKLLACITVIAGHNWMIFLKFKGGKGVSTTAGAFLALAPLVTICALSVWGVLVLLTRYVSAASLLAAISIPIFMYIFEQPGPYLWFAILVAASIVIKHRGNIKRLLNGTERRLGAKKNEGQA